MQGFIKVTLSTANKSLGLFVRLNFQFTVFTLCFKIALALAHSHPSNTPLKIPLVCRHLTANQNIFDV